MKMKKIRTGLGITVGALILGGVLSTAPIAAVAAEAVAPTSLSPEGVQPRGYYGAGTQSPGRTQTIAPGAEFTEGANVLLKYDEQVSGVKYRVVMPVPAGATFVSATQGGVYDPAANTVTWIFNGKTPAEAGGVTQESKSFLATFRAPSGSSEAVPEKTIQNAAVQSMMGGSITDWRQQFTYTYAHTFAAQPGTSADLGITKDVDRPKANVGDAVSYTLTVTNHGTAAVPSYTVTDALPAGIDTWSSPTSGVSLSGGTLTFEGGALAVGESKTVIVNGVVREPGATITNIAKVTSGTTDSNPSNNSDDAKVEVPTAGGPVPLGGVAGATVLAGAAATALTISRRRKRA
ncbi:DUF11 domain-containing protein [Microbacterium sp. CH1]|uniref:DUF11 domain-containing protein n=1 Tax=Microbacterium sp. CH1 TaxID=1770208 RepID=UPI0007883178|nr:DUF11 domain-containing protein [Microbacterium sp. CH1]KYJ96750.1 hypothetical protein AUV07_03015 [Microbacterium sp. CH1]